jgi:hypothetical protein
LIQVIILYQVPSLPHLQQPQTIKAIVTNNSTLRCYDETLIVFTVDDLPEASIPTSLTTVCDDEPNPLLQDGNLFDTSTFERQF